MPGIVTGRQYFFNFLQNDFHFELSIKFEFFQFQQFRLTIEYKIRYNQNNIDWFNTYRYLAGRLYTFRTMKRFFTATQVIILLSLDLPNVFISSIVEDIYYTPINRLLAYRRLRCRSIFMRIELYCRIKSYFVDYIQRAYSWLCVDPHQNSCRRKSRGFIQKRSF